MSALRHRSRSLAALRFLRRPSMGRPWLALSIAAAVLLLLFGGPAQAHKASDAYLQLRQQGDALTLRWDISLRDLDAMLELDRNDDQQLAWGEVASYGSVGLATGRPTAGRAVGGAVGANPIPIIVPCHRILASNGRITGYSGGNGIPTKAWLLDHEGIVHRTVGVVRTAVGVPA